MSEDGDYTEIAQNHLDDLEATAADDLWEAILDACELVLFHPRHAHRWSTTFINSRGETIRCLPIVGHEPYKVFWSMREEGSRIEAVIEYPTD